MAIADSYVRARIDGITKQNASDALREMGLSISDVIRLLLVRVAEERKLPFEVKVPNSKTIAAMKESQEGKVKRFSSVEDLMADLLSDDDDDDE